MDAPILTIVGAQVALGPLDSAQLPWYHQWVNDFAVVRTLARSPVPMTIEQTQAWLARHAGSEQVVAFTVYDAATNRPIGNAALLDIHDQYRSAMFAILIGESSYRGRGYGTETTRLMLEYAFMVVGLHSVWLAVAEYNVAGRRAYEKAGFREVGRRREAIWMGGTYWDEITMDCLVTEFTSPVLAQPVAPGGAPRR
ncbi:MAG TPA: GNAT family protein [Thermomicrobiaceae bacterium]|nr:GNAT family protein [Thermomicrobiaceae bacterium]